MKIHISSLFKLEMTRFVRARQESIQICILDNSLVKYVLPPIGGLVQVYDQSIVQRYVTKDFAAGATFDC